MAPPRRSGGVETWSAADAAGGASTLGSEALDLDRIGGRGGEEREDALENASRG